MNPNLHTPRVPAGLLMRGEGRVDETAKAEVALRLPTLCIVAEGEPGLWMLPVYGFPLNAAD